MKLLLSQVCLVILLVCSAFGYSIPDPKIELLSPQGFRISIPNEQGIVIVAFHISIDKEIRLSQPGDYSTDITESENDRWTYENTKITVEPGSKFNYWIHVQHGNFAYRKLGTQIVGGNVVDISDKTAKPSPIEPSNECEKSETTVDRRTVCRGELIFEDDFNSMNWTKWKQEIRIPNDDSDFVSFQNRQENCYVSNGNLHIMPNLLLELPGFNETRIRTGKLDLGVECTPIIDINQECSRQAGFSKILPPIVSARIRTKDFFTFKFGRIEVRAKLPKGDWLFPLILLEPLENNYGITGYASGQMRIAFIRGNEFLETRDGVDISGKRLSGGVVLSTGEALRDVLLKSSLQNSHMGNDFHTYTLTWTDKNISLKVDGEEYAVIRDNFSQLHKTHNLQHASLWGNGNTMAPFDREFFLTLAVSAGGHSDFPTGSVNGNQRVRKSWSNQDPKAELRFWNDRVNWLKSWNRDQVGLQVDYIKVYAL